MEVRRLAFNQWRLKLIELLNVDCMEYMETLPDKAFDLAIVDPPYGINRDGGETGKNWKVYEKKGWDAAIPSVEYFSELFRVSENQIIFGANYFSKYLPSSMGWIVWDKGQKLTMSDGELAFSSFEKALRIFTLNRVAIGESGGNIHPTQKPLRLYEWLLTNYAKPGQRILDTHLGSGSSAIAAKNFGVDFVGCELDKDYYDAAVLRFNNANSQDNLFANPQKPEQDTLSYV